MLDKCKELICEDNSEYTNAFVMLAGIINKDLLFDYREAYECFIIVCNNEDYNAYAWYLKSNYWEYVGIRADIATQMLLKSILIYPEYHKAWHRLGYILKTYISEDMRTARNIEGFENTLNSTIIAFKTVKSILSYPNIEDYNCYYV